jgi:hypothetical protein
MLKKRRTKLKTKQPLHQPSLRFSPTAWGKLRYLRDLGETEIGGFGVSAADDPLYVEEVLLVRQRCTPVSVAFDDGAVADLVDRLVDQGIGPGRCSRIWIHTHPGNCPRPSFVDEATFRRVFGRTEWSVMTILARNDAAYARLAFHVGPGASMEIPVTVDYNRPFAGTDSAAWEREYRETVFVEPAMRFPAYGDNDEIDDWLADFPPLEGGLHGVADAEPV